MASRLNLLLVVLDGARADHLSCYGYARETTPFLDEVAREGVRFSRLIANAASTVPSHATLFTGLYPVTHGATEESRALPPRHKVLGEYLEEAGYRTAAFCTNTWVSPETGFGRGFGTFFTQRRARRLAARALQYGRRASDRLLGRDDAGARRSNEAFSQWLAAGEEPFFAFVHYDETHPPLRPPPPHDQLFLPRGVSPRAAAQLVQRLVPGAAAFDESARGVLTAAYDSALHYVDSRLHEMASDLRQRGLWDRTLFVVTADHGECLGEHGQFGHDVGLYDDEIHVPLLLRCPPCVPQGFVGAGLAEMVDLLPTILRLLDLGDATGNLQGRPLLDSGRATEGRAFAISERFRPDPVVVRERFPGMDASTLLVRAKAIRTARGKFVWHSDEANELYDLVADPGETRNLVETDASLGDPLRRQLFDWLAGVEKYESSRGTAGAGMVQPVPVLRGGSVAATAMPEPSSSGS